MFWATINGDLPWPGFASSQGFALSTLSLSYLASVTMEWLLMKLKGLVSVAFYLKLTTPRTNSTPLHYSSCYLHIITAESKFSYTWLRRLVFEVVNTFFSDHNVEHAPCNQCQDWQSTNYTPCLSTRGLYTALYKTGKEMTHESNTGRK